MTGKRTLFVEPLLTAPEQETAERPRARFDATRGLTVLEDGQPLVCAESLAGSDTFTKIEGGDNDADDAALVAASSTTTMTFVRDESEDRDAPVAWGGTQLDTRGLPADVEQD